MKGREATFTLTETLEQDLIGTEWRAKDSHTDRRFGWGEVVDQDGDHITLLGNRWTGMPDRGLLVAHIGPDEVAIGRQRDAVIAVKNGASARQELRELLLRPEDSSAPQPVDRCLGTRSRRSQARGDRDGDGIPRYLRRAGTAGDRQDELHC